MGHPRRDRPAREIELRLTKQGINSYETARAQGERIRDCTDADQRPGDDPAA